MITWVGKIHLCMLPISDRINQGFVFSITMDQLNIETTCVVVFHYQCLELRDILLLFLTVVVLIFEIIHSCQYLSKMVVCSQTWCPYTIQAVGVWSIAPVVSALHQLPQPLVFFLLSFLLMLRLLGHKFSLLYPHQQQ